jgi:hypothetical protein
MSLEAKVLIGSGLFLLLLLGMVAWLVVGIPRA